MANNSLAVLIEFVRPEVARFAPFNFDIQMNEFVLTNGYSREIELSSWLFGGLKATTSLDGLDALANNAHQLEDELLSRIQKAIIEIEDQAELIALVDYKWPKAA